MSNYSCIKVLVACEFSGTVREAFAKRGFDAWSCDLLETEIPGKHYRGDVRDIAGERWDLLIAHPPCTHLAVSGARWWPEKQAEQRDALEFVRYLMGLVSHIPHVAIENPISIISREIRKPDQIIQPWMFGHGETKATCLWTHWLPILTPTNIVSGREQRIHRMPPSACRWKERSRTYQGVADAMADQWGAFVQSMRVRTAALAVQRRAMLHGPHAACDADTDRAVAAREHDDQRDGGIAA